MTRGKAPKPANDDMPDFGGPGTEDGTADVAVTPSFTYAGQAFHTRSFSMRRRRELMESVDSQDLRTFEDLLDKILTEDSYDRLEAIDEETPIPPETLSEIAVWLTRKVFGISADPKQSGRSAGRPKNGRKRTTG